MPWTHLLLALAAVFVWGTNFVVMRWGLDIFAPFTYGALRYTFSALPFLLFIRRPAVSWGKLAAFGGCIGCGQFGLLFYALQRDISPGLASLVIQSQVFFTIAFGAVLWRERLKTAQWGAFALALAGFALVAEHASGGSGVTPLGIALVLCAAMCWAGGNVVARTAGKVDALAFVVWSSPFGALPLWVAAFAQHDAASVLAELRGAGVGAWATVAWQAVANTLFGFGVWSWLLARHPAATVTPTALLVPVFGMASSALALHEGLPGWKLLAAALVLAGLALNVMATRAAPPKVKATPA